MTNATQGFTKVAVRRDPTIPPGAPARLFIVCPADDVEVTIPNDAETVTCPNCGTVYDRRGWVR